MRNLKTTTKSRLIKLGVSSLVLAGVVLPITEARGATVASPIGNLASVAASSSKDAWAVGCRSKENDISACTGDEDGTDSAFHWNGRSWKAVAVPMPRPPNPQDTIWGSLVSVTAISPTDAWAVGDSPYAGAQIVHWSGAAWKQVSVPSISGGYGKFYQLDAVTGTSATNAWAVGYGGNDQGIVLHWNGKLWKRVPSPNLGATYLYSVAATSGSNAWAVGSGFVDGNTTALIEHWNGRQWKVALDALPSFQTFLTGVGASSVKNGWAVGFTHATENVAALIHWNGGTWRRVTKGAGVGNPIGSSVVHGIATTSVTDAWAVGSRILHWNGLSWKSDHVPTVDGKSPQFAGVAATSSRNAWAIGDYSSAVGTPHVVLLHWNDKAWKQAVL